MADGVAHCAEKVGDTQHLFNTFTQLLKQLLEMSTFLYLCIL